MSIAYEANDTFRLVVSAYVPFYNDLLRNEVVSVQPNWLGGSINSFSPRLAPSLLKVSGAHRMIRYDMAVGINHDSKAYFRNVLLCENLIAGLWLYRWAYPSFDRDNISSLFITLKR